MNKASDFLGLPVLCIQDGALMGEVQNILFDEAAKAAIYLLISNGRKNLLLGFDKIQCKADAIVIASALDLADECDIDVTTLKSIINKQIYSVDGKNKGVILDVELFSSGKVCKILSENTQYTPSAFATIGDVAILKYTKRKSPAVKIPRDKTDRKVEIFEEKQVEYSNFNKVEENKTENDLYQIVEPKKPAFLELNSPLFSENALEKIVGREIEYAPDDERTPARIISDYDFLLGRTLLHDLYTYAGTPIAKANSIVTKELVESASRNGKLVELTLNSSYN